MEGFWTNKLEIRTQIKKCKIEDAIFYEIIFSWPSDIVSGTTCS